MISLGWGWTFRNWWWRDYADDTVCCESDGNTEIEKVYNVQDCLKCY